MLLLDIILKIVARAKEKRRGKKRNKRHAAWNGRNKTVFICRRHDRVFRKSKEIHTYTHIPKYLLELKNKFTKLQNTN